MKKLLGRFEINGVIVIYDGQTLNGRSAPLVVCPMCGEARRVTKSSVAEIRGGRSTGHCVACAAKVVSEAMKGRLTLLTDEILPTGSVIHWATRDPDKRYRAMVTCGKCGEQRMTTVVRSSSWTGYCPKCIGEGRRLEQHHLWKGGRIDDGSGYIMVLLDTLDESDRALAEPMARRGYVPEHRLVMARQLGRPLDSAELVHHLNGIKTDNRPSNLELVTSLTHSKENQVTTDRLRAEIQRLQAILDEHHILYEPRSEYQFANAGVQQRPTRAGAQYKGMGLPDECMPPVVRNLQ